MCNIPETKINASGRPTMIRRRANRAQRACLSCRSRKVRCDVTRQSPCSNCKWNTAECIVMESRKSPVRKKPKVHEIQQNESSKDDNLDNTKRASDSSSSLSSETIFPGRIRDENFTDLLHLRDFVHNTTTLIHQRAQAELQEDSCGQEDKTSDTMEWAFLKDPPMSTKTTTSFVDSGFHDESWCVLEQSSINASSPQTPPSLESAYKDRFDKFFCSGKTEVNGLGDDLLDNLLALPFDCLRHI